MKRVSMSGSLRGNVGKKDAKAQRVAGKVPCVIYGGKEQLHFSMEEVDFKIILNTPNAYILNLSIDGKEHVAILQDIQAHPVSDRILHADFLEVDESTPIIISVPIRVTGTSPGVLRGGKLVKKFRKLKVKALLNDLPDSIEVSIKKLDLDQSSRVSDLSLPNVEFLDLPTAIMVSVVSTRNIEAETPAK